MNILLALCHTLWKVLVLLFAFLLSFIYYGLHEFIFSDTIFENLLVYNPFCAK